MSHGYHDTASEAAQSAVLGFTYVNTLLANFVEGLAGLVMTINNVKIGQIAREIAEEDTSFDEKISGLYEAFDRMTDPETEKRIRDFCSKWENEYVTPEAMAQREKPPEIVCAEYVEEASAQNIPFSKRIGLLEQARAAAETTAQQAEIGDLIESVKEPRQKLNDGLEAIRKEGLTARQGMREVVAFMDSLGIPEEEKKAFRETAEQCERRGHDLCVTAFSADEVKQATALITQYHITFDPSTHIYSTPDGGIRVVTDGAYADTMQAILGICAWELGKADSPDRARFEADAYARTKIKSNAAVITAEYHGEDGAVMAQAAADWLNERLGGKKAAADIQYDEEGRPVSGTILVATDGSKDKKRISGEDDRAYATIVTAAAAASILLNGPGGDYLRQQTLHKLTVDRQIENAVYAASTGEAEKGGTVYFVRYGKDGRLTADSHIEFDKDGFIPTYNGIEGIAVPNTDQEKYQNALQAAVRNGNSERVFIPEEKMKALKENAITWQQQLNQQISAGVPIAEIYSGLIDEAKDRTKQPDRVACMAKIRMIEDTVCGEMERDGSYEDRLSRIDQMESGGQIRRRLISRSEALAAGETALMTASMFRGKNAENRNMYRDFRRSVSTKVTSLRDRTEKMERGPARRPGPLTFYSRVRRPDIGKESSIDGRDIAKVIDEINPEEILREGNEQDQNWIAGHPDAFLNLGADMEDNAVISMDSLYYGFDVPPTPYSERAEEKAEELRNSIAGQRTQKENDERTALTKQEPEQEIEK